VRLSNIKMPWRGNAHVMLAARAHGGLPYARRIAQVLFRRPFTWRMLWQQLEEEQVEWDGQELASSFMERREAYFCLRYAKINKVFDEYKPAYGVEFGIGFSGRCIEAVNEGYVYFASDRNDVMQYVHFVMNEVLGAHPKLHLSSLDVGDEKALLQYLDNLPKEGRMVMVGEGLFPHLSYEGMKVFFPQLARFLAGRPDTFMILSDVYLVAPIDEKIEEYRSSIAKSRGKPRKRLEALMPEYEAWMRRHFNASSGALESDEDMFAAWNLKAKPICFLQTESRGSIPPLTPEMVERARPNRFWILTA
jgi:hypothetical protein